jgi:hypothetical protein
VSQPEEDDTALLKSRTVGGAKLFIEKKTKSFEIPANSGGAMSTALNKVFAVEPDPDSVDLSTVDLDAIFDRFRIKSSGLTDQSFAAYKSRVRRAKSMYENWLDGKAWKSTSSAKKPSVNGRQPRSSEDRATTETVTSGSTRAGGASTRSSGPIRGDHDRESEGLFDYPVALVDSDITAILRLPRAYTKADAARMAALITALAVPDSSASTSA